MRAKPPLLDKPPVKERPLTQEEKLLWESFVAGNAVLPPPKKHTKENVRQPAASASSPKQSLPVAREGKSVLDLHGHTLSTAYGALHRFILQAQAHGIGKVLIITGKGRAEGYGSLRGMLPYWLEETELSSYVTGFRHADAQHGGDGAWIVRVRKNRSGHRH